MLTNAIKFSYANSEINLTAIADKKNILSSVEDQGSGMSAAIRDQLFGHGRTVTTPGTANETGTGLGLLLSKEIIELMGGKIWVEGQEQEARHSILPSEKRSVKLVRSGHPSTR